MNSFSTTCGNSGALSLRMKRRPALATGMEIIPADSLSCTPASATGSIRPESPSSSSKSTGLRGSTSTACSSGSSGSPWPTICTSPTGLPPAAMSSERSSSALVLMDRRSAFSRRPSGSSPVKYGGAAPAPESTGSGDSGSELATAGRPL
jgi:hypothetical protein